MFGADNDAALRFLGLGIVGALWLNAWQVRRALAAFAVSAARATRSSCATAIPTAFTVIYGCLVLCAGHRIWLSGLLLAPTDGHALGRGVLQSTANSYWSTNAFP